MPLYQRGAGQAEGNRSPDRLRRISSCAVRLSRVMKEIMTPLSSSVIASRA